MIRRYCDRCKKQLPADCGRSIWDIVRATHKEDPERKFIGSVASVVVNKDNEGEEDIDYTYLDLCSKCQAELNKYVDEFFETKPAKK